MCVHVFERTCAFVCVDCVDMYAKKCLSVFPSLILNRTFLLLFLRPTAGAFPCPCKFWRSPLYPAVSMHSKGETVSLPQTLAFDVDSYTLVECPCHPISGRSGEQPLDNPITPMPQDCEERLRNLYCSQSLENGWGEA